MSLFANDMILEIENPKDATKKKKKKIRTNKWIGKVAGYKINIQKSFMFLYTNELSEREIKKTIPFTVASKWIKIPRSKIELRRWKSENCKTLMKEIEDYTDKWKNQYC